MAACLFGKKCFLVAAGLSAIAHGAHVGDQQDPAAIRDPILHNFVADSFLDKGKGKGKGSGGFDTDEDELDLVDAHGPAMHGGLDGSTAFGITPEDEESYWEQVVETDQRLMALKMAQVTLMKQKQALLSKLPTTPPFEEDIEVLGMGKGKGKGKGAGDISPFEEDPMEDTDAAEDILGKGKGKGKGTGGLDAKGEDDADMVPDIPVVGGGNSTEAVENSTSAPLADAGNSTDAQPSDDSGATTGAPPADAGNSADAQPSGLAGATTAAPPLDDKEA